MQGGCKRLPEAGSVTHQAAAGGDVARPRACRRSKGGGGSAEDGGGHGQSSGRALWPELRGTAWPCSSHGGRAWEGETGGVASRGGAVEEQGAAGEEEAADGSGLHRRRKRSTARLTGGWQRDVQGGAMDRAWV